MSMPRATWPIRSTSRISASTRHLSLASFLVSACGYARFPPLLLLSVQNYGFLLLASRDAQGSPSGSNPVLLETQGRNKRQL